MVGEISPPLLACCAVLLQPRHARAPGPDPFLSPAIGRLILSFH
jgi:hypothetical protein